MKKRRRNSRPKPRRILVAVFAAGIMLVACQLAAGAGGKILVKRGIHGKSAKTLNYRHGRILNHI